MCAEPCYFSRTGVSLGSFYVGQVVLVAVKSVKADIQKMAVSLKVLELIFKILHKKFGTSENLVK